MKINLAIKEYENGVVLLFQENLKEDNLAIHSREFFCPFGVKAAVSRNQVIILLDNEKVSGAVRFYPRKNSHIISLYQFALKKEYCRKNNMKNILNKILEYEKYSKIESLCPKEIEFNKYYKNTDWEIEREDEKFNYWIWEKNIY